jgi:hypothetical protein
MLAYRPTPQGRITFVDTNDRDAESDRGGESTFEMDPQAVVWSLARTLVEGQRTLNHLRRGADSAERFGGAPPEQAAKFVADFRDSRNSGIARLTRYSSRVSNWHLKFTIPSDLLRLD